MAENRQKNKNRAKLLGNEELGGFMQELALLLHSAMPTADALYLLAEEQTEGRVKGLIKELADKVENGLPLSAALEQTGIFPQYACGLVAVGEQAGRLEEALAALGRHYEDRARLDRQLKAALMYPAMLLLIMLIVIVVLLSQVLPVFNDVYAYLGGRLTGVAGGLLVIGKALDAAMPVLLAVLVALVLFVAAFGAIEGFRGRITDSWRRLFGDKGVNRSINTARFAQALAMGLSSGLSLDKAVLLGAEMLADIPAAKARMLGGLDALDEGLPVAKAFAKADVLPQSCCRMLEFGIKSGSTDAAVAQIADKLAEESQQALAARVGQVEPALVLITSVLVGLILLAVMLPLMNIMTAIG